MVSRHNLMLIGIFVSIALGYVYLYSLHSLNYPQCSIPGFDFLRIEKFSCGGITNIVPIFLHKITGLEFVVIPGGESLIGCPAGEIEGVDNERPQHMVEFKPFLICRTEITQKGWMKLGGPYSRSARGWDYPAVSMNWEQANELCIKAGLRLPSESEWEYAARGGSLVSYCFGDKDDELSEYGWFDRNSGGHIHPVAKKKPNAYGLFDMHGNVWEWCQDNWYYYNMTSKSADPFIDKSLDRISRGGSSDCSSSLCRSAFRGLFRQDLHAGNVGFRPVCEFHSFVK